MITLDQSKAFEKALRIHSPREIIEIHNHKVFKWEGVFSPLNNLTIEQLLLLLSDKGKRSNISNITQNQTNMIKDEQVKEIYR